MPFSHARMLLAHESPPARAEGRRCDDETIVPSFLQTVRALFADRIQLLEQVGGGISRIGRTNFGRIDIVLINTPELVPEILIERVDQFQKGPLLRILARPILGDGLLPSEGDMTGEPRQ